MRNRTGLAAGAFYGETRDSFLLSCSDFIIRIGRGSVEGYAK